MTNAKSKFTDWHIKEYGFVPDFNNDDAKFALEAYQAAITHQKQEMLERLDAYDAERTAAMRTHLNSKIYEMTYTMAEIKKLLTAQEGL